MARGEGESEEAWPDDEPPLSDWCRAVSGSKSKAGAGREQEGRAGGEEGRKGEQGREEGEDGDRTEQGD